MNARSADTQPGAAVAGDQLYRRAVDACQRPRSLKQEAALLRSQGILMAQSGCGEAFNMLKGASQRNNVPVRVLAAGIVSRAAGRRRARGGQQSWAG
jgi:AmiR/NasT family two-component response regulator